FSITFMGSSQVGKTSILLQQCRSRFSDDYIPTMEDYYLTKVLVDDITVSLRILDTSGDTCCAVLHEQWIRNADAIILVYSVTDIASWCTSRDLYKRICRVRSDNPIVILVANKIDLLHLRQVPVHLGMELASTMECSFLELSVKYNTHVTDLFILAVRKI
ncbi:P-loop containing nucleoside triphosphate hydrolase protein, partial [Linnemannia elongata]